MADLADAILLAVKAHHGQKERAGEPYILHPMRVMMRQTSEAARIAAILHDVVEDTPVTLEDLRGAGFTDEIVEAVKLLTHVEGVSYEDYVALAKTNPIARAVKLADLEDNMRLERLNVLEDKDCARMKRYHLAWRELRLASNLE